MSSARLMVEYLKYK